MRRSRRAPAGDTVGLLDERDADPLRAGDVRHRHEIFRSDTARRSVTEHERGSRLSGGMQVGLRLTVRSVHFEHYSSTIELYPRAGYGPV